MHQGGRVSEVMPRWYEIALGEKAVMEVPGPGSNPRIVEYLRGCGLPEDLTERDETPWCGAFVAWCLRRAGVAVAQHPARAASWLSWGAPSDRRVGAVIVLRTRQRSEMTTSGYHVGFYVAADNGHVWVYGGNQGDQVKLSAFPLNRWEIVGVRWAS